MAPATRLYLSVLAGSSAEKARPVLASEDPRVVQAVVCALMEALGVEDANQVLPLRRIEEEEPIPAS